MSSDPIEVLRQLKEMDRRNAEWLGREDAKWHRDVAAAIDAALASLSAPKPESAEAVAWIVEGNVEQGLSFDKEAAEVMAFANCGTVRPLVYADTDPPRPEASDDAAGWQRMTDEASAIQMRHLDRNDGDVYHAMQSLVVKFGRRPNHPLTRERTAPQQPAAVDEAMVERAITAFFTHPGRGVNGTDDAMRAALTAALAGQQQGGES